MKPLLTFLSVSVFYIGGFCQDWQAIEKNDQFSVSASEIEYKSPSDGVHHQRIVFRYENHTSHPLELSFNREVTYGDAVTNDEQNFVVNIPARGIVEYDKSKTHDKTYYIFKKDYENFIKQSLKDYRIINLRAN